MFYRKDAVFMAVAGILASAGFAMADTDVKTPTLTLDPTVVTAAAQPAAPADGMLMTGLTKIGVGDTLKKLGINVYGWAEVGYTWNHRQSNTDGSASSVGAAGGIIPGPNNHEVGSHLMDNQHVLRIERQVACDKFDVGGMVEFLYGTDANGIHSSGMPFNGQDGTSIGAPDSDRFHPQSQFDITQAYLDVNVPVGNGLKIRVGKFVNMLGIETLNPTNNAFYSHSWVNNLGPTTETGIVGFYKLNDKWAFAGGISRGWDETFEDNNSCAIDVLGQVVYTPSKTWSTTFNFIAGPENANDTSHYRVLLNPVLRWKATDKLTLGLDNRYMTDSGINVEETGHTHAYGNAYGTAIYASYVINDYVTANARPEYFHNYQDSLLGDVSDVLHTSPDVPTTNLWGITLGVTITPMPKHWIGKNLSIRPEVRYTWAEDHIFNASATQSGYKDQLAFGCDLVYKY